MSCSASTAHSPQPIQPTRAKTAFGKIVGGLRALLRGIPWREGSATPYMPAFATALTDEQVAGIAGYLRRRFSDKPAWPDLPAQVKAARREGGA